MHKINKLHHLTYITWNQLDMAIISRKLLNQLFIVLHKLRVRSETLRSMSTCVPMCDVPFKLDKNLVSLNR